MKIQCGYLYRKECCEGQIYVLEAFIGRITYSGHIRHVRAGLVEQAGVLLLKLKNPDHSTYEGGLSGTR